MRADRRKIQERAAIGGKIHERVRRDFKVVVQAQRPAETIRHRVAVHKPDQQLATSAAQGREANLGGIGGAGVDPNVECRRDVHLAQQRSGRAIPRADVLIVVLHHGRGFSGLPQFRDRQLGVQHATRCQRNSVQYGLVGFAGRAECRCGAQRIWRPGRRLVLEIRGAQMDRQRLRAGVPKCDRDRYGTARVGQHHREIVCHQGALRESGPRAAAGQRGGQQTWVHGAPPLVPVPVVVGRAGCLRG